MIIKQGNVKVDTGDCNTAEEYEHAASVLELAAKMLRTLFVPKAQETEERERNGPN